MSGGRLLAAALVITLAAGACSDSKDRDKDVGAAPGPGSPITFPVDGHAAGDGHDHTQPTLVDSKTGKQGRIKETDRYSAVTPPAPSFRPPDDVGARGAIPLEAQVTPCVEHGQTFEAVFRSEPKMTVAAQIKWPNDQFSGLDATRGETAADGTFRWTVIVKPTALYGVAYLMAAVIDESPQGRTRDGTQGNWEFVVAPPGRC